MSKKKKQYLHDEKSSSEFRALNKGNKNQKVIGALSQIIRLSLPRDTYSMFEITA